MKEIGKPVNYGTEAYKIEICTRQTCSRCDGIGTILHRMWDRYYRMCETESIERENAKPPDCPEEIDCPDCRGAGMEEFWASIKTLRMVLGL